MSETVNNKASLQDVRKFFEMDGVKFRQEWMALDNASREAIRAGIGDGTMTY